MTNSTPWGLHWFRRDLRISGNEALRENWRQTKGRTLGLFCFDSKFLARDYFSHNRFAFFPETLKALRDDWRRHGGDLLVIDSQPERALQELSEHCRRQNISLPTLVTWNRDYEPFARARDQRVENLLKELGITATTARDHLLFEPHEIMKSEAKGDFYQIYSPYGRKWCAALASPIGAKRIAAQTGAASYFDLGADGTKKDLFPMRWSDLQLGDGTIWTDALDQFVAQNTSHVSIPIPKAGFFSAFAELRRFKKQVSDYKVNRDFPAIAGTSRLSIYLKNGSLTVTQILAELQIEKVNWESPSGETQFVKELAWREFYYSILYHRPDVERQSFLPQYTNLRWQNDTQHFAHWCAGTTGFPIVDAGMRELAKTGWMHNRVRMIVASFLTKDLLIDWRLGENYFMKKLLDGDLAANNGGWQWAASTGCDPQPYFRIFNPWLQGKKFDPEGAYIKKFVPELSGLTPKEIHDPEADRSRFGYPMPIVTHAIQRDKALRLYKTD